jgi:hypothetical protein
MKKNFRTMNELSDYLESLEQRIDNLENENQKLRRHITAVSKLPKTNLISDNFLKRAFATWGHFFTAHLIISIIGGICYLLWIVFIINSMFISAGTTTPTPSYFLLPTP